MAFVDEKERLAIWREHVFTVAENSQTRIISGDKRKLFNNVYVINGNAKGLEEMLGRKR
jgi:hypothetical protein